MGAIYAIFALLLMPSYLTGLAAVLRTVGVGVAASVAIASATTLLSLLMSPLHVVVYTTTRRVYYPTMGVIYFFGLPVPIPQIAIQEEVARLAVNVGGALIPIALSTYMLAMLPPLYALGAVASALAASVLVYHMSKVVPGVGVVTPGFLPPLVSLALSLWAGGLTPAVAYIVGVYGTLLGADVYNIRRILAQMPPLASIGGAGVWDGIYLTGIMAAILGLIIR